MREKHKNYQKITTSMKRKPSTHRPCQSAATFAAGSATHSVDWGQSSENAPHQGEDASRACQSTAHHEVESSGRFSAESRMKTIKGLARLDQDILHLWFEHKLFIGVIARQLGVSHRIVRRVVLAKIRPVASDVDMSDTPSTLFAEGRKGATS